MSARSVRVAVPLIVLLVLLGLALWRSIPAAGPGTVLVLEDRAVAGPIRAVIAPWSARRVLPASQRVTSQVPIELGQGSSWPMQVVAEIRLEPDAFTAETRRALLGGLDPAGVVANRAPSALAELVRRTPAREILARPAALAAPLRAPLAAGLPAGVRIASLDVKVSAPPEQARAAALSAARTGLRPPVARVLHIGLDAADWEIIDRLVAKGELPNLARLEREGVRADLIPYTPMISPLLWTTALTGRAPDEHGIDDFILFKDEDEHDPVPMTSRFRKVPALWEILAAAGQRSGFVNHWATQPSEQVPGALVSELAARAVARQPGALPAGLAWPPDVMTPVAGELWSYDGVPAAAVRTYAPALDDGAIASAKKFLSDVDARRRWKDENKLGRRMPPDAFLVDLAVTSHNVETVARRLLSQADLGVVSVYFEDIDMCGHNFMHLSPPPMTNAPPDEVAKYGPVVDNCYRQQDAMVGRLVAAAGPGTVVIVHSDHGFQSATRRPPGIVPFEHGQPVEWHRGRGMFLASGGPVKAGARAADVSIFDIAPTLLALRGVPPGENMPGRVRADLLTDAAAAGLPTARVPAWDGLVAPRQYGAGDEAAMASAQAEAIEQLRGLGYVDVESQPAAGGAAKPAAARTTAEAHPGSVYFRNLATYLLAENRYDAAAAALETALAHKPLPKTYSMLSEARAGLNDLAGAVSALDDGFGHFPDSMPGDAVRWLVELRLRQHDVAGAEDAFSRYRERAKSEPGVAETIAGLLAEAKGDRAAAKAGFLAALEADPRASGAAEHFAALADSPAERARLEPFLVRGLQQDQRLDRYWQMLGLLYGERGEAERAAQCFHQAALLVPGNEHLRVNEAVAWMRARRPDMARAVYEMLAHGGTTDTTVWVNLGSLRASAGDWRGALVAWERARSLGENSPELARSIDEARRRAR